MKTKEKGIKDVCVGLLIFWGGIFLCIIIKNYFMEILGLLLLLFAITLLGTIILFDKLPCKTQNKIKRTMKEISTVFGKIKDSIIDGFMESLEFIAETISFAIIWYFVLHSVAVALPMGVGCSFMMNVKN